MDLWAKHSETVLGILREALQMLADEGATGSEPELNRRLFDCLLGANSLRYRQGLPSFDWPPTWEGRNPPSPETHGSVVEKKIPDFHWGYVDHQASDPANSGKYFVVECKKLGAKTAAGWKFNVHYVTDGVLRFLHEDWRYGKDASSGAMVGFVFSMALPQVLAEVQESLVGVAAPLLSEPGDGDRTLHVYDHRLERSFLHSPFTLKHLWVELGN